MVTYEKYYEFSILLRVSFCRFVFLLNVICKKVKKIDFEAYNFFLF